MKTNFSDDALRVITILGCIAVTGCTSLDLSTKGINDIRAGNCAKGMAELKQGATSSNTQELAGSAKFLGDAYLYGGCGVTTDNETAKFYYALAYQHGNQVSSVGYICADHGVKSAQCQQASDAWEANRAAAVQAIMAAGPPPPTLTFDDVHQMQAGILNSTPRRPPVNTSSAYTPPAAAYTAQATTTNAAVYDNSLDRCVKLGGDGQSVFFQNTCNASLTIAFNQPAGIGTGATDCGSGARCTFGAFGIGYSANNNTIYAVCPQGDYVESAPGVQWAGSGPFRCRRP